MGGVDAKALQQQIVSAREDFGNSNRIVGSLNSRMDSAKHDAWPQPTAQISLLIKKIKLN